jgi:hypothetical protein
MTQKVVTNDDAVAGPKTCFISIFGTFETFVTNLRVTRYFVENVKKVFFKNQPTLLYCSVLVPPV